MSSIGALCDRLGKKFLTFLLGNLGATSGLWVNSSPVKVKLIIFPFFLPEGNTILPITDKEACAYTKVGFSLKLGLKKIVLTPKFPLYTYASPV